MGAFKVSGGGFSWVGDAEDVDCADAVDLRGKTVLPGSIDVHNHPTHIAMTMVDADVLAAAPEMFS